MSQLSNALVIPNRNKWEYLEYLFLEGRALYAVLEERKYVAETVLLFPSSLCHQFGNKNNFKAWGPKETHSLYE